MKHLFKCLKRYKAECVFAPLFKLLEASMELLVPLVVDAIVTHGVGAGDRAYVLHAALLLLAFGAVGLAFAITAQYFAAKAAVGCASELRMRLFGKLQSLSFSDIDEMGASQMVNRMTSDVQQVQNGVNMTLRIFLRSPIVVFGATALAFVVDVRAALVFVALIPILTAVIYAVMGVCLPKYRAVQEKLDGVYSSARENLSGARVLRAFRKEKDEAQAFSARCGGLERAQERVGLLSSLTAPMTFLLINLGAVLLVFLGARGVDLGRLDQGDVLALYGYLSLILVELVKLTNLIVTTTRTVACARRISAVMELRSEPEVLSQNTEKCGDGVEFEHVSFTYAGGAAPALHDITFRVGRGKTVGILGGTGTGKSTLVRLLPRFYPATEGVVRLGGVDVSAIPAKQLRARIGYVPQKATLFQGTIASNLRFGQEDATDEALMDAIRIAQAGDVVAAKGGLYAEIAQEGKNLSGGQRQRLTIARALVKKPEVLILDDAASALDYATDAALRAALKTLDCTVFVVSQRVAAVMSADEILVLDEGKIAARGTHEELLSVPLYREIVASQTEERV